MAVVPLRKAGEAWHLMSGPQDDFDPRQLHYAVDIDGRAVCLPVPEQLVRL